MIDVRFRDFEDYYITKCDLMSRSELLYNWCCEKYIGKKVICSCTQTQEKNGGYRLHILDIYGNTYNDLVKMFTVCRSSNMRYGIWICDIRSFRFDKNKHVYCVVTPSIYVKENSDLCIEDYDMCSRAGLWLIITQSGQFVDSIYRWHYPVSLHEPNFDQLYEAFPEYSDPQDHSEVARKMLNELLKDDVLDLNFIRKVGIQLNTLSPYETKLQSVYTAISYGIGQYDKAYPLFVSKFKLYNDSNSQFTIKANANIYINRQLEVYNKFIADGIMEPIDGDDLDKTEAALACRAYIKLSEKKNKSAAKKLKEILQSHPNLVIKQQQ